jgi:hypothetical protein
MWIFFFVGFVNWVTEGEGGVTSVKTATPNWTTLYFSAVDFIDVYRACDVPGEVHRRWGGE